MEYIHKTYKYKLRLTKSQEKTINEWMGTCRFVYNLAIETKEWAWRQQKKSVSWVDLSKDLTKLRSEVDWIADVPRNTQEEVLKDHDKAMQKFFSGGGYPKFTSKGKRDSLKFPDPPIIDGNKIKLPKIGWLRFFNSRTIEGELRNASIVKKNEQYFICILARQERKPSRHPNHKNHVGIDMGLAFFASLSTGEQIDNPRFFVELERQLRIAQRSLSRKKRGSNRYKKQRLVVAKLRAKVARQRADFLHKVSRRLVDEYGLIAIEDLKVSNMVKFGYLGKHISDASWSMFADMLAYKTEETNGTLVRVDPKYTSQTCSDCGCINNKSRISQSKFVCVECGSESNADVNASKNILARAMASVTQREPLGCACGDDGSL